MKRMYLGLLPIIILSAFCAQAEKGTSGVVANETAAAFPQAPVFSIKDLVGKTISSEDFKDKVVILNFWATWCPPCKAEIPGFVEAYAEYKDQGLEIVGLSLDRLSSEKVLEFAKSFDVNYPVAMVTEEVYEAYQPGQYIPASIIIDKKGNIRHRHVGYLDKSDITKYFQNLMNE
jgi:peroxiredoxin